jgi:hypothetical protein
LALVLLNLATVIVVIMTVINTDAAAADAAEKEDLVLQDNFAQETAVMVEDPNM